MSGIKLRPPGVVTGDEYLQLLDACKEGGYALPAVNVTGTNSLNAVMEAAAKAKSDIIIQMSNGGAQFYAGQGGLQIQCAPAFWDQFRLLSTFSCWPKNTVFALFCIPITAIASFCLGLTV